jgi:xanthine dehydrogenase YagR molybdenum-binding subunit
MTMLLDPSTNIGDLSQADALARAPRRIEGLDKVSGRARYAGDLSAATIGGELDVAVAITATQATGRILSIDATAALACPGVRILVSHENAPKLHKVLATNGAEIGDLLPLQDDRISYGGQCIALLVADTLENARTAAALVTVRYSAPEGNPAFTLDQGKSRIEDVKKVGAGDPGQVKLGNAVRAYEASVHQVDIRVDTSPHHHNAMEPGAIVASWDDDGGLTVHVPTQFSYGDAVILGQAFGFGLKDRLPRVIAQVLSGIEFDNKVRVVSPLVGGAFGGKNANVHLLLAPIAAKLNGRPVKLVLTRQQVFTMMPFRGESRQRFRLGADASGKLQSIIQDSVAAQGAGGQYCEPMGETIPKSYACENILVHTQAARLDTGAPGWMRGPGACLGQFALETAMDVLAYRLCIDPLDFRLLNHADVEPGTGNEWSSKSLRSCYEVAGRRIGWFDRNPVVGSMREGRHLVGYGVATSVYPVRQMPALARIIMGADGQARVQTAAHEIGQGMITSLTQVAAESLGLPLDHVRLEFGDTALPYGSMTVGSMTTLTNGAAIFEAAKLVKEALAKRAVRDPNSPLYRQHRHDIDVVNGRLVHPDGPSEAVVELMARLGEDMIEEEAITGRDFGHSKYGRQVFGAQFAKVLIDPDTMHIQVEQYIGAFAGGRPINPLLVRSQLIGGMVWCLGQALLEESVIDARTGAWMNRSLGEALVPTNADIDVIDAIIVDEDDSRGHPLGIKGMGEIASVGGSAAIGNAIFHATGIRLRQLPFRIDRLLAGNVDYP